MPYNTIQVEKQDRIATITINRPDKLNALNDEVIVELSRAADQASLDEETGAVIITGTGDRAFAAGADIRELSTQQPFEARERALAGQAAFRKFETMPKPVVAAVNGFALGGGCELALACHMRVAAEGAKFGQPEVNLGITPGFGGTQRLPRLVGRGRALELILTGRMVDAQEALAIGLVNAVVSSDELIPHTRELLSGILTKGPLAVALAIDAVDRGLEMPLPDALMLEASHFGLLAASSDMREGMQAFLEKRKAEFRGE